MRDPPLPASLAGRVFGVAADVRGVEDVAPGLAKVLELELSEAELRYLIDLGTRVLAAAVDARPR